MFKFGQSIAWCGFLILLGCASAAVSAAEAPSVAMLYLSDGDFLAGRLADCNDSGTIRWQMRGATTPFDFPSATVRAAHFPPPRADLAANGEFLFELSNGDVVYGSFLGITPERFELDTPRFGRLQVDRGEIRRIVRCQRSSPSEYRGPNGLAEWKQADEEQWREEAGRLITNIARARAQTKLSIPSKARIEFEIAGGSDLEFAFILSSGTSDAELQRGFRFEVWQRSLVALRELEDRADMTVVCELNASENRVQIEALLDQEEGTMSIHAPDGKQLATIKVPPQTGKKPETLEWISIVNGKGELRLERLAIGRWSGQLPPQIEADKPAICQMDESVLYGEVIGYEAVHKQFVVRSSESESERIDAAKVASIFPALVAQPADYPFRIGLHDGTRLSGKLTKVANGKVFVSRGGLDHPLMCAVGEVRSVVNLSQGINLSVPKKSNGWLELEGVRSHGSLIAAAATAGNTCLVWQPRQSTTGSPLHRNVSGRIVYRETARQQTRNDRSARARRNLEVQRQQQLRIAQQLQRQRGGVVRQTLRALTTGPQGVRTPNPNGAGILYLIAGDRIPCDATSIDEAGVHFKSSVVDATFAPHSAVKALELVTNWSAVALDEEKRQRLLTLPRMQKNNPPAHLVASTGGDLLRTNVVSLSADTLVVESRLETKRIPRDRVACLIWLHNESANPPTDSPPIPPAAPAEVTDSPRVQAVRADGVRLTFVPRECNGTELMGTSKLLGDCQLDLRKVDFLVLGSMIETLADEQAFHEWKLTDALEPRYVSADAQASPGETPAGGSGLIGKAAPDIRLDLLEGGEFKLSERKGQVVVLDFWASWCGPCIQSLPQIDAVVAEFAERGVKLVAVNMQEDREAAASALERLKIKPIVALDIDGAAAEHYQVTAIPHTVVIDAKGNIARLFVGSSPETAAQLRTAIEDLLAGPAE
jgi:thiol-disulfide isomerase/thioredoxin